MQTSSFIQHVRPVLCCLALACGASGVSAQAAAPTTFPDAAASDPAKLGWMVGAPPPADRTVRFDDGSYFNFPAMRWSVSSRRASSR